MKKKGQIAFIVCAGLALGSYYVFFKRTPSLAGEVRRMRDCWQDKDYQCVASFVKPAELNGYGVTTQQVAQLLSEYISPILVEDKKLDQIKFEDSPQGLGFALLDTSNQLRISGMMVRDGRQVFCLDWVKMLLLECATRQYGKSGGRPSIVDSFTAYKSQADNDRQALEKLGFRGLLRAETIVTWEEWSATCAVTVQRQVERAAAKKT